MDYRCWREGKLLLIALRSGVRFLESLLEAFGVHVRVDLRGGNVRMPEHFLDAHNLGAVF